MKRRKIVMSNISGTEVVLISATSRMKLTAYERTVKVDEAIKKLNSEGKKVINIIDGPILPFGPLGNVYCEVTILWEKVSDTTNQSNGNSISSPAVNVTSENLQSVLTRIDLFLEDGEWEKADAFCEQVLNHDATNAVVYVKKLMAELRVKRMEDLANCNKSFENSNNYKKALRFADATLAETLKSYVSAIKRHDEEKRLAEAQKKQEDEYSEALKIYSFAKTVEDFKKAESAFLKLSYYKDSRQKASSCKNKWQSLVYERAIKRTKSEVLYDLRKAKEEFSSLGDYKDSLIQIDDLNSKIISLEKQENIKKEKTIKKIKIVATIATSVLFVVIAFIVVLNTIIIPNSKYNDAVILMDAGKYTEAIPLFESLAGYKDSYSKIDACNTAILDGKYDEAVALMSSGNIVEAYEALKALDGYKDSREKANSIYNLYNLKLAKEGTRVAFGSYEQNNYISGLKEDIYWRVLEVKDGKALIISERALDCKPYNESNKDVTWETCSLRKWLNNEFLKTAFSDAEKEMICCVTVSADKSSYWETDPGNSTQDKVFLLSQSEADIYFKNTTSRACNASDYALANGASIDKNDYCYWLLRTPGPSQKYATMVFNGNYGNNDYFYSKVDSPEAVRPALWIDIS